MVRWSMPQNITDYFQIIAEKTKPRPNDSVILAGLIGLLRNEALLEEMIKRELLAAEAIANGLNLSEGELQDYIAQQREALKSAPLEMKEIEMNLIRLSGLSEDAYWQSEKTLKNYERFLLINKLTEHLNLKTKKEYEELENRLLKETKIQINKRELVCIF